MLKLLQWQKGALGIAVAKNVTNNDLYVFLYYTESEGQDGENLASVNKDMEEFH
jgi:hypothetical protein